MLQSSIRLGDAVLTKEDISSIGTPQWFSDKVISFWLEYIQHSMIRNEDKVAILPPNITHLISILDSMWILSGNYDKHTIETKKRLTKR